MGASAAARDLAAGPRAALLLAGFTLWSCDESAPGATDVGSGALPEAGADEPPRIEDAGFGGGDTPDGGALCLVDGTVQVEGVRVPVAPVAELPSTAGGRAPDLSCIGRPFSEDASSERVCLTRCLDFFGFSPSPEQVLELEFHLFDALTSDGGVIDPSYHRLTLEERSPGRRLNIGAEVRATETLQCPSGYQLELGFPEQGAAMRSDRSYIIRVRSRAVADPSWVTLYLWDFARRADETERRGTRCETLGARIPDTGVGFPVLSATTLLDALEASETNVEGSLSLFDGEGRGYAMIEARDCGVLGEALSGLSFGFLPEPRAVGVWEGDTFLPDRAITGARGLGIGLGVVPTSSATARVATGLNPSGACTEAYGGLRYSVFPDSVTYVRIDRETTLD